MKDAVGSILVRAGVYALLVAAHLPAVAVPNPLVYPTHFKVQCTVQGDATALARRALVDGILARSTEEERNQSVVRFEGMLTSMYGLKRPLSSVSSPEGRAYLSRAAFTALNGYVISAQMAQGSMAKSATVPVEITSVSGNMIYALIEPYEGSATLQRFWDRAQRVDRDLMAIAPARRTYAAWLLRGVIYADPIAIESARAGYCASGPSTAENALIERLAAPDGETKPRAR